MPERKYALPIFLIVQITIVRILAHYPEFVERYYSNGMYVYISRFLRSLFGLFPFSIGDLLYFVLIAILLRKVYLLFTPGKINWKEVTLGILSFISVFYFLFHVLWAMNYHRVPLYEKMQIEKEYTDADLLAFTEKLIVITNSLHNQITGDDSLKVTVPYSRQQVFAKNLDGYQNLSGEYSDFTYTHPSIKNSLISVPLSYMGFTGYLNPFTNEAQVNSKMPLYSFASTTNHEMAHQIGYASESEANFIGFLASIKNKDLYIQYSGYTMALRYCISNWEVRDEEKARVLLKKIHPGIRKNFRESRDFWKEYNSFIEVGFQVFYDHFLKLNQQKDGLESYSKFVDLMVNYYKDRELG